MYLQEDRSHCALQVVMAQLQCVSAFGVDHWLALLQVAMVQLRSRSDLQA